MLINCPNGDKLDNATYIWVNVETQEMGCGNCVDWPMEPEHDWRCHTHIELGGEVIDIITDQYVMWDTTDFWKLGLEGAIHQVTMNDYKVIASRRIRLTKGQECSPADSAEAFVVGTRPEPGSTPTTKWSSTWGLSSSPSLARARTTSPTPSSSMQSAWRR